MSLELLFDHFAEIASTRGGVVKLRETILQLAMQGKLVSLDPSDEPAGELLKRIQAEKAKLVAEGTIKKDKPLPAIVEEEIPYELPDGWEWVRFGTITYNRDSERIPVSEQERSLKEKKYDYYGASGVIDKIDNYIFEGDLLLIGEDGANLINRSTPIAFIASGKYWVNNHAHVIDTINYTLMKYLCAFINSIDLKPYVTGTAQPKMNQAKMNSIVIALPPLAEQDRIVAKVEELFVLCDRLEADNVKQAEKQQHWVASAVNHLLSAPNTREFSKYWGHIVANFDALISTPQVVKELRQAILQLAVQGKLVPQDADDEPAAELLKRVKAEKERLIAEGKIKQEKPLPTIPEDEIPYDLPDGWQWVRVVDISDVGTGSTPLKEKKEYYQDGTIPWVTSSATNKPFIIQAEQYITEKALIENNMRVFPVGTLIVAMYGQGKTRGQISELMLEAAINQACAAIILISQDDIVKKYIKLYFAKIYIEIRELASGGAQPNLNLKKIKETIIPLPPLAEQLRIVAKVNKLMELCDKLEEQLLLMEEKGSSFTDAIFYKIGARLK